MEKTLDDYMPKDHGADQIRVQSDYIAPSHELQPSIPFSENMPNQKLNMDEFDPKAPHRQ